MDSFYRRMDVEDFADEIIDGVDTNIESVMAINFGHSKELHVEQTDSELLGRLFHDGKDYVSTFENQETMENAIKDMVYSFALEIATWVKSGPGEFDSIRDYRNLTLSATVTPPGEPLGRGFGADLKERETRDIRMVLERSSEDIAPFGFLMKTAFADLRGKTTAETGLEYTKQQVMDENIIDFYSAVDETAFNMRGVYDGINFKPTKNQNHEDQLTMTAEINGKRYLAHIAEFHKRPKIYERCGLINRRLHHEKEIPDKILAAAYEAKRMLDVIERSYHYPKDFDQTEIFENQVKTLEYKDLGWER